MSDRQALSRAYDAQAATYGTVRNKRYDAFRDEMLDRFAELVRPVGDDVLDLGSGPGHEAVLLRERGLDPVAVDFSPAMARQCSARGLPAVVMDLYALGIAAETFAGAWMSFSLLHVPKADASGILRRVATTLRPGGIMMVLLFEGDGEGPRAGDIAKFGVARHFSYYRPEELTALASEHLVGVESHRLDISPRPTLVVAGRTPF